VAVAKAVAGQAQPDVVAPPCDGATLDACFAARISDAELSSLSEVRLKTGPARHIGCDAGPHRLTVKSHSGG
jgi:hypothetical protein